MATAQASTPSSSATAGSTDKRWKIAAIILALIVAIWLVGGVGFWIGGGGSSRGYAPQVTTLTPTAPASTSATVPAAQPPAPIWIESGGQQPNAEIVAQVEAKGKRLVKGHPGNPDCFKLPNGGMRCPNHWE